MQFTPIEQEPEQEPQQVHQASTKMLSIKKKVSIADNIIASASSNANTLQEEIELIIQSDLSTEEKIEILLDKNAALNVKIKGLKQRAAQIRCMDEMDLIGQYLSILRSDSDNLVEEEDEEDMDVFDIIGYNAKLVGLKKSNALIVTGDAGVGKTHEALEAISFLNPVSNTKLVEVNDDEESDTEDEQDTEDEEDTDDIENQEEVEHLPIEDENTNKTTDSEIVYYNELELPKHEVSTKQLKKKKKKKKIEVSANSFNNIHSGYFVAKGDISPAALYELLFIHRDGLLLFDDCDSVFKDSDCVNYLKAALDTYPIREVSKMRATNTFNSLGMTDSEMWNEYEITGKLPNQFKFTGNIIIISNIHEDKFDKALISRCLHVEVRLTKAQVLARMKKLIFNIRQTVCLEWKLEALHHLEYLTNNYPCKFELNLRELIHAIDIKSGYPDETIRLGGKDVPVWKQLVKKLIVKPKSKYVRI